MKQKTRNYIFIGAMAGALGLFGGTFLGEYLTQPIKVYLRDYRKSLNDPGREEIITRNRSNETEIFIKKGAEYEYMPLNEYISSKKRAAVDNSELEIKAIEQERRSLETEGMLNR